VTLLNTEIENSIVMTGARIDCGKKITDSLIGKDAEILDSAQRLPEGHSHPLKTRLRRRLRRGYED